MLKHLLDAAPLSVSSLGLGKPGVLERFYHWVTSDHIYIQPVAPCDIVGDCSVILSKGAKIAIANGVLYGMHRAAAEVVLITAGRRSAAASSAIIGCSGLSAGKRRSRDIEIATPILSFYP